MAKYLYQRDLPLTQQQKDYKSVKDYYVGICTYNKYRYPCVGQMVCVCKIVYL